MSRYRLEITLDDELLAKLDKLRGHEPRASFVKRVLGEYAAGMMNPRWLVPAAFEQTLGEAKEPLARSQVGPGSVSSSEGARPTVSAPASEGTPLPKIAPRRQPR